MNTSQEVQEKVEEVSSLIVSLEQKIAEEERNNPGVDSIREKILNLKRKVGIYREILKKYSSSPFDFRNMC